MIKKYVARWRREERNSVSENASNAASESSPLLFSARQEPVVPAENHAYMSPRRLNAPRSTRTPTPGATPVVGYIEGYGSTSLVPSPVYRGNYLSSYTYICELCFNDYIASISFDNGSLN